MIYNIHYDICAMLITVFAIIFTLVKKGLRIRQNKILLILFITTFFAALFDIISSVANSYTEEWSFFARDLMNYAYLILQNGMCILFLMYVASVCEFLYGNKKKSFFVAAAVFPYFTDLVVLALNPFLRWAFYYDENKLYCHRGAFYVLYVNAFLYLVASAYVLSRYGKKVARGKRTVCFLFIFASLFSVGLQMLIPNVLLALCVESLCLFGVLLVMDNEDEIIDAVSGCFNRRLFLQNNTQRIGISLKYDILTVKLLQMNFHTATLGMELTNKAIAQVGEFLRQLSREAEVYYYDNDSFALLYFREETGEEMMEELNRRFGEIWVIGDTKLHLDAAQQRITVGEQISSIEELLLIVDTKTPAQNNIMQNAEENASIFDYRRELSVERALKRAIATDGFTVNYQPVWNEKKNMITRAEVLLQLKDDELGVVSPGEFMPIAEKKGVSIDIGKIMLHKVCRMYKERGLAELGIEVIEMKATKLQCMNANLADMAVEIVKEYGVFACNFGFEVSTETLIDNQEEIIVNLHKLKNAGFHLSIDDYGYQAMRLFNLFEYPVDCVRIDKHFLWKAAEAPSSIILLKNTVRMFREMKLLTIAEGVENIYQKELAAEVNCELQQGFFFSKAVEEEGFYRYCRGFNLR